MKPLISKFKKPYKIYLDSYFKKTEKDELNVIKEDWFYSLSYILPSQTFEPNTFIEITSDLFGQLKKTYLIKYRMVELNHETQKIRAELDQFSLSTTLSHDLKYPQNTSGLVKSNNLYIKFKLILNNTKGRISVNNKKELRDQTMVQLAKISSIEQLFCATCSKDYFKNFISESNNLQNYIKAIIITEARKLNAK